MHCVRLSHSAEIRQNEIAAGALLDAPPGFLWFTVVRKITPVVRMRLFTLNFDDAETDLDEDTARELFESLATPVLRDAEARLRKVMEG